MRSQPEKNASTELLHGRAVSEVYQDYVEPLILEWADMDPRPSVSDLNEKCRFPWTVWNSVVLTDFYPENSMVVRVEELRRLVSDAPPAAQALVEFYITRKRSLFAEFRYMFRNCEFYQKLDGEIRCRAEATLPPGVDVGLVLSSNRL